MAVPRTLLSVLRDFIPETIFTQHQFHFSFVNENHNVPPPPITHNIPPPPHSHIMYPAPPPQSHIMYSPTHDAGGLQGELLQLVGTHTLPALHVIT